MNTQAEFEDCRHAAQQHGVPLKAVMQAAVAAHAERAAVGSAA